MKNIVLFGAGAHTQVIIDIIERQCIYKIIFLILIILTINC